MLQTELNLRSKESNSRGGILKLPNGIVHHTITSFQELDIKKNKGSEDSLVTQLYCQCLNERSFDPIRTWLNLIHFSF